MTAPPPSHPNPSATPPNVRPRFQRAARDTGATPAPAPRERDLAPALRLPHHQEGCPRSRVIRLLPAAPRTEERRRTATGSFTDCSRDPTVVGREATRPFWRNCDRNSAFAHHVVRVAVKGERVLATVKANLFDGADAGMLRFLGKMTSWREKARRVWIPQAEALPNNRKVAGEPLCHPSD